MSYINRMDSELTELNNKIEALSNFAHSDCALFCSLPIIEQEDMWDQLYAMELYAQVLGRRLTRALAQ